MGSHIPEGLRGCFPKDRRIARILPVALVPGSFGILGRNFLLTSDAHVTSVPGGVFIVLTKGAKRGWDSRAGEGEAGVAGLGGGWLEVGSKPSMKVPALSVPQVGSRRKPRAGDGDIGPPPCPLPLSVCLASSPSCWSRYQSPA